MSTRINHNILSIQARNAMHKSSMRMETAVQRLSSGLRINSSWDDPAGLAVSERFRAQISSMVEAERNTNYNINLLATAEGSMAAIDENLIRMRAVAVQASNGALLPSDRGALDLEFQSLKSEITRIANSTNYAGIYLINGAYTATQSQGFKFHIGSNNVKGEDYYWIDIDNMTSEALGIVNQEVTDTAKAQAAIDVLDEAIHSKDSARTRIGSYVNRLQNTVLNLQVSQERAVASESQIRDADIAEEMSEFVRAQILQQSGVAMLSQANMLPQIIAGLIG